MERHRERRNKPIVELDILRETLRTTLAMLAVDYQTKPNSFGRCSTIFSGSMQSTGDFAETNPFERCVAAPPPSGEDALRPSPGPARFSQKSRKRQARRTALSRSGRGAEREAWPSGVLRLGEGLRESRNYQTKPNRAASTRLLFSRWLKSGPLSKKSLRVGPSAPAASARDDIEEK